MPPQKEDLIFAENKRQQHTGDIWAVQWKQWKQNFKRELESNERTPFYCKLWLC